MSALHLLFAFLSGILVCIVGLVVAFFLDKSPDPFDEMNERIGRIEAALDKPHDCESRAVDATPLANSNECDL